MSSHEPTQSHKGLDEPKKKSFQIIPPNKIALKKMFATFSTMFTLSNRKCEISSGKWGEMKTFRSFFGFQVAMGGRKHREASQGAIRLKLRTFSSQGKSQDNYTSI